MNPRDVVLPSDRTRSQGQYVCLRTGQPCGLLPVELKRIVFVPPLWICWRAVVLLPLAQSPRLTFWNNLRMALPVLPLTSFSFVLWGSIALHEALDLARGSPLELVVRCSVLAAFVVPGVLWFLMQRLIDRYEFVRLLRYDNRAGTVTVRFATPELAALVRAVLRLAPA